MEIVDTLADRLEPLGHGQLFGAPEAVPMYSYSRPTGPFWAGVVECLEDRGFTEPEITKYLQSKAVRWQFDFAWDEAVRNVGFLLCSDLEEGKIREWL